MAKQLHVNWCNHWNSELPRSIIVAYQSSFAMLDDLDRFQGQNRRFFFTLNTCFFSTLRKWAGENFRWSYLPYSMKMAGPREAIQHMRLGLWIQNRKRWMWNQLDLLWTRDSSGKWRCKGIPRFPRFPTETVIILVVTWGVWNGSKKSFWNNQLKLQKILKTCFFTCIFSHIF